MARRVLLVVIAMLAAAPAAHAADPIMPLSEVRPGMHCTALSVVRGTTIASFDVEVIDTIAPELPLTGSRILIRTSGPAVDATGIGPGFSGSPIYCDGRNAGAISESIGDYGNDVVLATPIQEILSANPVPAPRGSRVLKDTRKPLALPLSATGLGPRTRAVLARAARRAGRSVLAAPPGPLGGFPQQPLVPGAAVAASLASGDVTLGSVGTVTYRDGDRIWAFGHPLDGIGPRSLFLQDAYVFDVIGNPVDAPDVGAQTYKLATSGGHTQGSVLNDTTSAIAGVVGRDPASVPLRTVVHGNGKLVVLDARLADERKLGLGMGLSLIAPLMASSGLESVLRSAEPARLGMCVRFRVAGRKPIGFCNRYFSADDALADLSTATALVDAFDLPILPVRGVEVRLRADPGVPQDVIVGASVAGTVEPGQTAPLRVRVRRRGSGDARTLSLRVKVPRDVEPGTRILSVRGVGQGPDVSLEDDLLGAFDILIGGDDGAPAAPSTFADLAEQIRSMHRSLGIVARFPNRPKQLVESSGQVLFDGRASATVRVVSPPE